MICHSPRCSMFNFLFSMDNKRNIKRKVLFSLGSSHLNSFTFTSNATFFRSIFKYRLLAFLLVLSVGPL